MGGGKERVAPGCLSPGASLRVLRGGKPSSVLSTLKVALAYCLNYRKEIYMRSESSKHLGLGLVVGVALFAGFYWDPLGVMPETDLGVPLGIGFGSGFSATVISWIAAARKA